jgi:hypothetical protein
MRAPEGSLKSPARSRVVAFAPRGANGAVFTTAFLPDDAEAANIAICRGNPRMYGQLNRITDPPVFAPIADNIVRGALAQKTSPVSPVSSALHRRVRRSPLPPTPKAQCRMNPTIRIVTRGSNGELRTKDYEKHETVLKMHTQIGIDDCSTDLSLRGMPVFRGLIGPMPEGKDVVRYETPEVFETLTKEWSIVTNSRSRRRRSTTN